MRSSTVVCSLAAFSIGLGIGFLVWGIRADELRWTLANTSRDLLQTQAWLRDEIQSSDEQQQRLSGQLTKALGDLARARADLGRSTGLIKQEAPSGRRTAGRPELVTSERDEVLAVTTVPGLPSR
jgi:hypothetical protein